MSYPQFEFEVVDGERRLTVDMIGLIHLKRVLDMAVVQALELVPKRRNEIGSDPYVFNGQPAIGPLTVDKPFERPGFQLRLAVTDFAKTQDVWLQLLDKAVPAHRDLHLAAVVRRLESEGTKVAPTGNKSNKLTETVAAEAMAAKAAKAAEVEQRLRAQAGSSPSDEIIKNTVDALNTHAKRENEALLDRLGAITIDKGGIRPNYRSMLDFVYAEQFLVGGDPEKYPVGIKFSKDRGLYVIHDTKRGSLHVHNTDWVIWTNAEIIVMSDATFKLTFEAITAAHWDTINLGRQRAGLKPL